ncbi:MAG: hypothetical protein H6725_07665 [Sandaracinaceae bacterium]|nr:hypothetical protein [Sandaracinaceae bacterium]
MSPHSGGVRDRNDARRRPAGGLAEVTVQRRRDAGDHALYAMLLEWGWDFVIRFCDRIHVTNAKGETRTAKEWGTSTGHAKMLADVRVTKERQPIPAIVTVHAKA